MSIPLMIIGVPLMASVVVYFFRQWVWVQSVLAGIVCCLLMILTLQAPLGQMVVFAGRDVLVEASWVWLGRSFTFTQDDRLMLTFIFSTALLFFSGAPATRVSRTFLPVGLAILSFLVATVLVQPFMYAALFLEIVAALSVFMLSDREHRSTQGSLRLLLFVTLGVSFILLAAWQLDTYQTNPDTVAILRRATILLSIGFLILLATVPFHSWLPTVAQEAAPYATAFIFSIMQAAVFLFLLDVFAQYSWFKGNPAVPTIFRMAGLAMVIVGGVFAFAQRNLGRLMGYSVLIDCGAALLALGVGTPDSLRVAISIVGLRIMALWVWGLGLGILSAGYGGEFDRIRGRARVYPFASAAVLLGGLSVAGLPLMAGFAGRWALMQFLATHDVLAAIMLLLAGVSVILGHLRGLAALLSSSASETSEWSVGEQPVTIIFSGAGALAVLAVGVFPQWLLPAVTRTVDVLVLLIG